VRVGDELLLAPLVLLRLLLLLSGGQAHGHRLLIGIPSVLRIRIRDPDPWDPYVFGGLPDPDPLVRDMEPDSDICEAKLRIPIIAYEIT
jgi:hypothetical protein